MSIRSRRRGGFPWQSVLIFAVGIAIGAVVLALVLGGQQDGTGRLAAVPTSTATLPASDEPANDDTTPQAQPSDETYERTLPAPTEVDEPEPTRYPATPEPAPTLPPSPEPTATPVEWTREAIEAAVRDAVERFQEAKEYSQRTGDVSRLPEVLAGQALQRQTDLVNQAHQANCYWDISLDEPMTYEFIEVRDDDYVSVRVFKTESRRYYCNDTLVSSWTGDAYSTVYVVERIGDAWYVTERE